MRSPRTLRGRLALWSCAAVLVGLVAFAAAAWIVIYVEESREAESGVVDADDPVVEADDQVLPAFAIAAPIGLVCALLAATYAARRALAPIERAVREAADISVDRFDRRMTLPDPAHELRPLAGALNELLDRLQHGYDALAAFSADASHELRTPLAAVCSELEIGLRRPRTAEDWEASARTSLDELRRLSGVVDAMLRFARADGIRAEDGEVDLDELASEVAAIHDEQARARGVELRCELSDGEVGGAGGGRGAIGGDVGAGARVRGDADLLATALGNLVGNALRLTPAGGRVTLRVDGTALHVDDTGPGLPADRAALFVPFALRDTPGAGVGLGLPIARRIVARHGGTLSAADRAAGGARFTIALPRA